MNLPCIPLNSWQEIMFLVWMMLILCFLFMQLLLPSPSPFPREAVPTNRLLIHQCSTTGKSTQAERCIPTASTFYSEGSNFIMFSF